jgi:DNA-directed RNA polymerase alpha subunit
MAILDFQKPDQVIITENTETHGVFELQPLEPGYGITIGNALRRVLLSSLEGYAITQFRINEVPEKLIPPSNPCIADKILCLHLKLVGKLIPTSLAQALRLLPSSMHFI